MEAIGYKRWMNSRTQVALQKKMDVVKTTSRKDWLVEGVSRQKKFYHYRVGLRKSYLLLEVGSMTDES